MTKRPLMVGPEHHRIALVVSLSVLAVACSAGRSLNDAPFVDSRREGPVFLEIRNDNFNDARIYTDWNGDRRRVGTIVGKTTDTLEVAWRYPSLRLEVDLIGAGGFTTDRLTVWPGETVFLAIPPILDAAPVGAWGVGRTPN